MPEQKKYNPFEILQFEFDSDGWFSSCWIPKSVATCCCCQSKLFIQASGWTFEDCGFYLPDLFDLDCERGMECFEEFENSPMWRMPYVYWLPIEEKCKAWLHQMLLIYYNVNPYPKKWLEKNGQMNLFNKNDKVKNLKLTESTVQPQKSSNNL